jgi:prepilin-type N-terminal cleavage/methylation domain-containing protein
MYIQHQSDRFSPVTRWRPRPLLATDYWLLATSRRAFTLVELLVVILILATLIGLLTSAVTRGLGVGKRSRNRSEISQLELAIANFQQRFKVGYLPSRMKLAEVFSAANYPNVGVPGSLDADSVQFLTQMFPGILTNTGGTYGGTWTTGIDWNGNGAIDAGAVILEGDQCLVFFLGGIPGPSTASHALLTSPPTYTYPVGTPPACLGFSTNPKNPADATTPDRIDPFFEFSSNRLVIINVPDPTNPDPVRIVPSATVPTSYFYSYLDTYGTSDGYGGYVAGAPYAYFSAYKTGNGYNRYYAPAATPPAPYSDCSWLNVWPYKETAARYLLPNKFQIISAGGDLQFGHGSDLNAAAPIYWTPAAAGQIYPEGTPGFDDQCNFTSSLLGSGQE